MMDALTYLRQVDSSGLDVVKLKEKPESNPTEVKFNVGKEELLRTLASNISIVPQKDRVPVIQNALLEVGKDFVRISVTNQEIFIRSNVYGSEVEQTGKVLIPARKLLSILKDSQGDQVYIEVSGKKISIAIGGGSWEISRPVVGVEMYPGFDPTCQSFSDISKMEFYKAVETVKYAARKDFSRANLRIIKVASGKFDAYDGSRFQRISTSMSDVSMEIPAFSIDLLLKKLKAFSSEEVKVGKNEDYLVFILGNEIFAVKSPKLEYPNVDTQVLRPVLGNRHEFVVDKETLIDAVKAVRIVADADNGAIGLLLENNRVEVFTRDGDERASTTVDCLWKSKKRLVVVNHVQLKELMDAHGEKECKFFLGDDTKMRKSTLVLKSSDNSSIGFVSQLAAAAIGVREIS